MQGTDEFTHAVRSPGRVNLVGGHTDYAGGRVLPAATDLHTSLRARRAETVQVRSETVDDTAVFDPRSPTFEGDWADYVKGVYAALADAGYEPGGFVGEITATLPSGVGLSSSASLELAVLALLDTLYDLGLECDEMARLGARAENDYVGVSCGLLDQLAVAHGEPNTALFLDTHTFERESVPVPGDLSILVFHTGVERSLRETPYNERRATVESALARLGAETVSDVSESDIETLPAEERRRLGYVRRENERVLRAKRALRAGDITKVGETLTAAHRDFAGAFDASCPELDFAVEAAVEAGAYGGRVTGAGWGGAAIALAPRGESEAIGAELAEKYGKEFDHDASWWTVVPSEGARCRELER